MRFLAAIVIGVIAGTGAVVALVHDQSALTPAPVRAVFSNITPYKPTGQYGTAASPAPSGGSSPGGAPPAGSGTATRSAYSYGSGG